MKILVVDDERSVLDTLSTYLGLKGHDCQVAENGREALMKLEENWPDILICDFVMPVFSGIQLLKDLPDRFPGKATTIIMITGRAEAAEAQQAYDLGAKWVLQKPISPAILEELLHSVASKERTAQ